MVSLHVDFGVSIKSTQQEQRRIENEIVRVAHVTFYCGKFSIDIFYLAAQGKE